MAANPVIVTASGSIEKVDPGIIVIGDPDGFDTVTGHYYFPSATADSLKATYPVSSTSATIPGVTLGSNMICFGPADIKELPGGHCTAAITFRGLLNATGTRTAQGDETASVREKEYDSITGLPGTTGAVRARILEQQGGMSIRLITFNKPSRPTTNTGSGLLPGGITSSTPSQFTINNAYKIYCFPSGWICYNWSSKQVLPGIWFVTADYKYEAPFSYA